MEGEDLDASMSNFRQLLNKLCPDGLLVTNDAAGNGQQSGSSQIERAPSHSIE